MDKLYDVHMKVPARLLSALIELVENEGIVVSIGDQNQPTVSKRLYANGKRKKDIPGPSAVVVALGSGPQHPKRIARAIAKHGFAESSAASCISRARDSGLVEKNINGAWQLTKAGEQHMQQLNSEHVKTS